jgi:hypothetical protein
MGANLEPAGVDGNAVAQHLKWMPFGWRSRERAGKKRAGARAVA